MVRDNLSVMECWLGMISSLVSNLCREMPWCSLYREAADNFGLALVLSSFSTGLNCRLYRLYLPL